MRKLNTHNGHKNIHWWHTSLILSNDEDIYQYSMMIISSWQSGNITKSQATEKIFKNLCTEGQKYLDGTSYHYVKGACKKWISDNSGNWMIL